QKPLPSYVPPSIFRIPCPCCSGGLGAPPAGGASLGLRRTVPSLWNCTGGKYFGTLKLMVCSDPIIFHVIGAPAFTVNSSGTNASIAACSSLGLMSPPNGP